MMNSMRIVKFFIRVLVVLSSFTGVFAYAADKMDSKEMSGDLALENIMEDGLTVATFAGGCFWCTESDF
jgi:hypothetical protein